MPTPRTFLFLIVASLLLIAVPPADAQPGADADTANVGSRMAIITVKNRSALRMDLRLARVHFSGDQLKAADPSTTRADVTQYVRSAEVWTKQARTNKANRSHSTVQGSAAQEFEFRINDPSLRKAFLIHQPKCIRSSL